MASRRQRRRRHEAAVHHGRQQRVRLRAALGELPAVLATAELHRLMEERGYEQDSRTGKWRRQVPPTRALTVRDLGDGFEEHAIEAVVKPRRGPSWSGILKKRNAKRKAR